MDDTQLSAVFTSPLGALRLSVRCRGLVGVDLIEGTSTGTGGDDPGAAPGLLGQTVLAEAQRQLEAYFTGDLRTFDLPLRPRGTPFQLAVWAAVREIPHGETTSYAALARRLGRPRAARAVGRAVGRNPLAIVVPCHRVVGADGSLTGFAWGLAHKRRLLELEATMPTIT